MRDRSLRTAAATALLALALGVGPAAAQQPAMPQKPEPTVPEIFTLMGQYVRVAYNNHGFVTMGYRMAQEAIGEDWMLLEVGITLRAKNKNMKLTRKDISIRTPDGTVIPLATQQEYGKAGYLPALNMRAKVARDSINYFPPDASRPCAIQFFANLGGAGPQLSFDEVELSSDRGCLGRLYFHVPGKIQIGQHWLDVNFGESQVQVPFRTLTKEEAKAFQKSWEDIKKEHEKSLQ